MRCRSCGRQIDLKPARGGASPGYLFIAFVIFTGLSLLLAWMEIDSAAWSSAVVAVMVLLGNVISYNEVVNEKKRSGDVEEGKVVCGHCGYQNSIYPWSV